MKKRFPLLNIRQSGFIKLLLLLRFQTFTLLLAAALSLAAAYATLRIPLLVGRAIDCLVGPGQVDFQRLGRLSLEIACMAAFGALAQFNMSLCGNVILNKTDKTIVNTTPEDYVFAIYNNDCVGAAHCTDNGELYLTVHGSEKLTNKPIRFQLWKAATGKVYNLTPDTLVLFAHGAVYGCGKDDPVQLQTGGSEMQTIALNPGWSWISTYLNIPAALSTAITAEQPWTEGDLIKNPATRKFCTYSETADKFVGSLKTLDYWQMYMVNSFEENNMHLFGFTLPEDSMHITLKGNGQWNALPCMFSQVMTLRDAMSDYYDHASTGDLIKAQNRFAVFSDDDRWVGDLTALTPGEGYLMRRMEEGTVTVNFYPHKASAPKKITDRFQDDLGAQNTDLFTNPKASTNMTMIAKLNELTNEGTRSRGCPNHD